MQRGSGMAAAKMGTADSERRLGRFRLRELIGRDGEARLHRALDANGQAVALWTIPLARLCADAMSLERFRRTAGATAQLSHPAIPAILASGEHAGTAFVATALVEGPTLADRLADGALSLDDSVATLDRVLGALDAAHRAGIVHGALGAETIRHSGSTAMVTGFGRTALTAAQASRSDDLAAAARLIERLLSGHNGHPAVASLLERVRVSGGDAFPDAASLRHAVAALTGTPLPASEATPQRARRWPLWLGGMTLAGGLAAGAVLMNRPMPTMPSALSSQPATATTAPATAPAAAVSSPPEPASAPEVPVAPRRPPVAAVTQALRAIPCALVAVEEAGGRLLVSGTAMGAQAETAVREAVEAAAGGWEHGFDLATADAQFCGPLASVAAALDANRGLAEPLTASLATAEAATAEGSGPQLNAGDPLILEIGAPARPVRIQSDYFTVDGIVIHLLPNPSDSGTTLAAGASRRLGDRDDGGRYWTIGPPYGTELLLTIATAEPLFPTPRPEQESAADYLAALVEALATLPDDAPAPLAAARFITTGP
ncbi:serine/threonine protein kinase [Azospirillum sp. B21]|uniref:serine/threonine protein kinase n=1 Tax=Azospirillum sp. B21 TaxID=2607496 RepID=UPI0011EFC848|nr:serine/threonine protein kinase [Azospirillum sp. B21]KAA0573774.1 serine/threonine protein kinase [Azospirillum sp. B21]